MKQTPDDLDKVRRAFEQMCPVSEQDWKFLKAYLQPKEFKKGDVFIKMGQQCNHIGFLSKGIARVYYQIDGKDITSFFNTPGRNIIVSAFTSFLSRKPSYENVHFLKDTELFLLSYDDLQKVYDTCPTIQKAGRLLAEYNYVLSMERIYSLQHASAMDRYQFMLKTYAGLLNQVPHHYVASYLGITPESLSRIRKQAVSRRK